MGKLLSFDKSRPIISADSIKRLRSSLKNDSDQEMLQKLYDTSLDPIQLILIEEIARLKGYNLITFFDEEPPKSYA